MPSEKGEIKVFMFTSKQFVETKEEFQRNLERFIAKSEGQPRKYDFEG